MDEKERYMKIIPFCRVKEYRNFKYFGESILKNTIEFE